MLAGAAVGPWQCPGPRNSCPAVCCRERAVPAIAYPTPSSVLHLLILFNVGGPLLFPTHTDFFFVPILFCFHV